MQNGGKIVGQTHHMLISTWGKRWRDVELCMLTVYIDDSGTSPSQQVAIATALIIPARQIIRLENEWDRFARKEGFTRFHTSEFVARNAKSEFANWDDEKQRRVFARVRQISMKYGVRAISIAVNKKDYDEIVPQDFKNYLGKEHYTWAARQTIAWVDTFFDGSKAAREWVFHWIEPHEPARGQVEEIMAQLDWVSRKRGLSFDYTNYSFRRDEKIPGLQCVDAISWVSYRFALNIFCKTPLPPLAEVSWRELQGDKGQAGWLAAQTIVREKLDRSIKNAIADGVAMQFFNEWQQYRNGEV